MSSMHSFQKPFLSYHGCMCLLGICVCVCVGGGGGVILCSDWANEPTVCLNFLYNPTVKHPAADTRLRDPRDKLRGLSVLKHTHTQGKYYA